MRLAGAGILLLACAGLLGAAIGPVFGRPDRRIIITWRAVPDDVRAGQERRFALAEPQRQSESRWAYVPIRRDVATLQAIVGSPLIAATDGIDRQAFAISHSAPLTERRGGLVESAAGARTVKLLAYVTGAAGTALIGWSLLTLAASERQRLVRARSSFTGFTSRWRAGVMRVVAAAGLWPPTQVIRRVIAFAIRGVPAVSPGAAGLFRIVFGLAVVAIAAAEPVHRRAIDPFDLSRAPGIYGDLVRALASSPQALQAIDLALVVCGVLFVAGVLTRLTYASFVVAFVLWACLLTVDRSPHVLSGLALALITLLPARWGDGYSVDAWIRARRGERTPATSIIYGYVIWVPGFVLGLGFAAAAYSKVKDGPAWILNGTVKYHFVTDLHQALVSWGPSLASLPGVAILLSAAAVAIEAAVPLASFTRDARLRLAAGLTTWSLLTGFVLFQGIFWPSWWVLGLGFLPWGYVAPGAGCCPSGDAWVAARPARVWMPLVVALLIALQVVVSLERIESRPLLTAYDMYSTTYRNDEEYERAANLVYRVVADTPQGSRDLPDCVLSDVEAARLATALHDTLSTDVRRRLIEVTAPCLAAAPDADSVRFIGDRMVFDWRLGVSVWKRGIDVIGPLRIRPE